MNQKTLAILAVSCSVFLIPSCNQKPKHGAELTQEEPPSLASVVKVAEPRTSGQLLKGFYGVEQNSWRWTAGKFTVALRPPGGSEVKGATLRLDLVVPDAVTNKVGSIKLAASVGGVALAPETFPKSGGYVYDRDVPAAALKGDKVQVDFTLDKFLPPGESDHRELGVIVSRIGLESK